MHQGPSTTLRVVTALATCSIAVFGTIGAVGATPSNGQATGAPDLEVLSERYNAAQYRVERAGAVLAGTESRIRVAETQANRIRALVRGRAAALYRGAAGGGAIAAFDAATVDDLGRRTEYVVAVARPDHVLLQGLSASLTRLRAERADQRAARDRLHAEAAAAAAAKRRLVEQAAASARAHAQPAGDGAGPIGTPQSMRVVAAASPVATTTTAGAPAASGADPPSTAPPVTTPPTTRPPAPPAPSPSPSSRAGTAVAFARAQLGKPYVFATAGPDTYDCSGLTMAAWAAAGARMPHYSGAQAALFPKVGWDQLQPGDIVVFYSDYHHVGLYIGGGMMIHAPQTGDVVKIAPAWRTTFQFGVRPR